MKQKYQQGEELMMKRVALGLSVKEIAEKLNLSEDYIYRIERGDRAIPWKRLYEFTQAYRISGKGASVLIDTIIEDLAERLQVMFAIQERREFVKKNKEGKRK